MPQTQGTGMEQIAGTAMEKRLPAAATPSSYDWMESSLFEELRGGLATNGETKPNNRLGFLLMTLGTG